MSKRQPDRRPERPSRPSSRSHTLPDIHLWHEVASTVSPLKRTLARRTKLLSHLGDEPLPLPGPPAPQPRKAPQFQPKPSYRSDGKPGRPNGHGIEPGMKKRLQRGTMEIDGTIDLHGMRQVEAHAALSRFIHARVARGDRTILVITGKGLKKLDRDAATIVEAGVLRTMLPIWLSEPALAPLVAGWDVSAQSHGGEGAFYVRLRRSPALVR
jgi:DNA-nicking Smr family endonuclease